MLCSFANAIKKATNHNQMQAYCMGMRLTIDNPDGWIKNNKKRNKINMKIFPR